MSIDLPVVATPANAPVSLGVDGSLGFDERWAAWQAKGADHDRSLRRKAIFAAPILILLAVVALYALFGR